MSDPTEGLSRRQFLRTLALSAGSLGVAGATLDQIIRVGLASAAASGKDTLVIISPADIITIDPHIAYDTPSLLPLRGIYETLVTLKGSTLEIAPQLATAWSSTPDGRQWTFRLRPGVQFHDGSTLTSEAVKVTFERLMAINRGFAWAFLSLVSRVSTPNPLTVRFDLSRPDASFLAKLAAVAGGMVVSPKALRKHTSGNDFAQTWLQEHAVGTGPYTLERWDKGRQIVLSRFPEYWGGRSGPGPRRVIIKVVTDPDRQRLMLERGEADTGWIIATNVIDELARHPDITVRESPSMQILYIAMNTQRAPLNDVRIRQAISYAFDYERARRTIFNNRVGRLFGPLPAADPAHLSADEWPYRRDLQQARALLGRSLYPNGHFAVTCSVAEGFDWYRPVAQILQANLRELNIDLTIQEMPPAALMSRLARFETAPDFMPVTNIPDFADSSSMLLSAFSRSAWGSAGWNFSFYANDGVEDLLRRASATTERATRIQMFQEIQRLIVQDAPAIFIANPLSRVPLRTTVKGYEYNPLSVDTFDLHKMYKR